VDSRFPYDGIIEQPLARLRQRTAIAFRAGKLRSEHPKICDALEKLVARESPEALEIFRREREKTQGALVRDELFEPPLLNTPVLQLLWGATLGAVALDRPEHMPPVENTDLWRRLAADETLEEERRFCAQVAASLPGLRERTGSLKVEWGPPLRGYPELGYYCDPQTSTVNLDLPWTLIIGIEPARSLLLREAAHGLGTLYFTDEMQKLRTEMVAIKAQESRTEEEHTRMIHLAAQWLARFDVTVEAENNYACRFAADRGEVSAQDYAASLNYAETVTGGIREARKDLVKPLPETVPVKVKFANLLRALHYAFFRNNGLFPDDEGGWAKAGVRAELISTSDGSKSGPAALEELAQMCKKMEDTQPSLSDRTSGDVWHARRMRECSLERGRIADQIFDRFAAHMIPELEKEAEANPDEVMDRLEKMSPSEKKDQQQDRRRQPQPGEDGEESDENADGEKDGDTAEVDDKGTRRDAKLPPKDPRRAKGLEEEGEPQPGEGEGQDADGEGQEGEGPGEGEGEGPGEGEGEGEGPGEGDGDGDGDGPDGEGDGDGDGDGEYGDSEAKDPHESEEAKEGEGGRNHGNTWTDEEPDSDDGSYNEYLKIIEPHRDLIRQAADIMKKIQEKLTVTIQDPSVKNSLVPEDGDVSRFQFQALQDRLIKQFSGQAIDESDFETFKLDGPIRKIPAKTEIHIWVDGSGSMSGQPVEMAMTTGCILYEAAREAGMDVYIGMLGDPHPLPIAEPGMSDRDIGRRIAGVRRGQGGDKDYLASSIGRMVDITLKKKKDRHLPVGNTHAFVISDGRFTDEPLALDHVKSVNDNCPHASLDFVLINGNKSLQIERLADELNRKAARPTIGYKDVASFQQIHEGLMELLEQRLKTVRKEDAIPLSQKQKEFKNVKVLKDYANRRSR
jgi:hypothetical protein